MKKNKYEITIITLTRNNLDELERTITNICKQKFEESIEVLVLDGSDYIIARENKNFIKRKKVKLKSKIFLNHINVNEYKIFGIYKSMNFGIKKARGEFIIFMNSGDEFYNKSSIFKLYNEIKSLNQKSVFCFGQAQIISEIGINWMLPGIDIDDIYKWLRFMLPNHQSMIVSRNVLDKINFNEECYIAADELWKKALFKSKIRWSYIKEPVAKFYIGGISSSKPKFSQLKLKIQNKYISNIRKLIFFIKFLIPIKIYKYYAFIQKIKLKFIEKILLKLI